MTARRIARATAGGRTVVAEVDGPHLYPLAGDPFGAAERTGERLDLAGTRLRAPVDPGRFFAVIGGFTLAASTAGDAPTAPTAPATADRGQPHLCPKAVPSTSGPEGEIVVPPFAGTVWAEAEMAVVVGRELRGATPAEAAGAIWGYTCCNDVTAPQLLPNFALAKAVDTFASLGPWVATDLTHERIRAGLAIEARVNGRTVQSGTTAHYSFEPWEVLSALSTYLTLRPGDVVTLGTPPPAAEVRPGDTVEIEVEGIGVLVNHVVAG